MLLHWLVWGQLAPKYPDEDRPFFPPSCCSTSTSISLYPHSCSFMLLLDVVIGDMKDARHFFHALISVTRIKIVSNHLYIDLVVWEPICFLYEVIHHWVVLEREFYECLHLYIAQKLAPNSHEECAEACVQHVCYRPIRTLQILLQFHSQWDPRNLVVGQCLLRA